MWETWVQSLGWEDPLQKGTSGVFPYSCLENPVGRGAWWVTVQGVEKSWTWLRDLTLFIHFSFIAWGKLIFTLPSIFNISAPPPCSTVEGYNWRAKKKKKKKQPKSTKTKINTKSTPKTILLKQVHLALRILSPLSFVCSFNCSQWQILPCWHQAAQRYLEITALECPSHPGWFTVGCDYEWSLSRSM